MYAPSFVTGNIVQRVGALPVISVGGLLILLFVAVNLTGVEGLQFWGALVMLGIGWNLMFVGATTLLSETYRPRDQARVQAFNEFLFCGCWAVTPLARGDHSRSQYSGRVSHRTVVPVVRSHA